MLIVVDISLARLIKEIPWNANDLFKRINYVEQPGYHIRNTFPRVDRVYIPQVDSTRNLLNDLENCCVNYGVPGKTPEVYVPVYARKGKSKRFLRWQKITGGVL
jgi:hypothetical protein